MIKTTIAPVGKTELVLKTKRFPPRLPYQPIFYPVLDEAYASKSHGIRIRRTKPPASKDTSSAFM
jgi:hypothetical protein